jgi:pilus assembly protein CpaB
LAAVAAMLAVLTAITAARPEGPAQVQAVVLRTERPGGARLAAGDLEVRAVTAADVPRGYLSDPGGTVGRTLAAPAAEGQVLTELALVTARAPVAAGHVVAPLRLVDADLARLLRPGDVVDVVAAEEQTAAARVVAPAARVVTVPAAGEDVPTEAPGTLVLVEVVPSAALALARAAAAGELSVTWR